VSLFGRRTKILLDPYKQFRFGIMYLVVNFIFSILMLTVFTYYMWDIFAAIQFLFKLNDAESMMTLKKFMVPAFIGLGMSVLFVVVTLYLSVKYTHQFYGPMVSIKRYLDKQISGENPDPIKIRKTDQLQDLVVRLNTLAALNTENISSHSLFELVSYLKKIKNDEHPIKPNISPDDPLFELSTLLDQVINSRLN